MKIVDVVQGSPEWFAVRLGIPTASNFSNIITTKGEPSKQAQKYMYRLAGESVSGQMEETYQNAAMTRGIEMEAEARALYEVVKGVSVQQVGFCLGNSYGASPDGLIGDDGCLEIKCPTIAVHVEYLLSGKLPTTYFQQVHGEMFVAERKWCDFVSYYPGLKPLIIRVERDENFISKLESELKSFCSELETTINTIK